MTILAGADLRLLLKAARHPSRAVTRLVLRARLARSSPREARTRLLAFLSERMGADAARLAAEFRDSEFLSWVRQRRAELERFHGPTRLGTTSEFGCEALYLIVRAARPRVLVETGVLYGASSAHLLAALEHGGQGELHSIEIGRDPREPGHDFFVPSGLRSRWDLIIGDSRRELPALLRRCATVDLFHHDSLHTFSHMTWEFETVFPHLSPSGVLSSDDVLNPPSLPGIFRRDPFSAFCARRQLTCTTFRNLGIALMGEPAGR